MIDEDSKVGCLGESSVIIIKGTGVLKQSKKVIGFVFTAQS